MQSTDSQRSCTAMRDLDVLPNHRKHKILCLGILFFIFFAWGILSGLVDPGIPSMQIRNLLGFVNFLLCITGILAVLFWCRFDAREHRCRLSKRLSAVIVLIAIVGVPIYLIKSRGMGKGIVAILLFFLFLLSLSIISGVADEIVCRILNR